MKNYLRALTIAALFVVVCVNAAAASPAHASPVPAPSPSGYIYHTVRPGENLYRISLRYGVSMYAIMQANGLRNPNYVYVGQVLRIPTGPVNPPAPQPVPTPSKGFYYCVVAGDTLAIIAARFGTTVYAIMQANGLASPNVIYVGQALWIPVSCCVGTPPPATWRGEYFNNERLAGAASVVRYDKAINFDWGLGWPSPKISADYFSVRWTRSLWLGTGTYRFTVTTDDGVRLWVDNVLVIDQWSEQPGTSFSADVPLGAGTHTIRMEYFELTGIALAHLGWEKISDAGPGPCVGCPIDGAPTGAWLGAYFNDISLGDTPVFTRTDAAIDFDWGRGSPGSDIDVNFWSARWTRTVNFSAGRYRFHVIVDDAVRLYVDGKVLIDEWDDNPGTEFIADKQLSSGNHTIKVEYYERAYDAKIKVWWEKLN